MKLQATGQDLGECKSADQERTEVGSHTSEKHPGLTCSLNSTQHLTAYLYFQSSEDTKTRDMEFRLSDPRWGARTQTLGPASSAAFQARQQGAGWEAEQPGLELALKAVAVTHPK